ncbi:MAG: ROK family glucokinase, partial [Clostridiales bacterium]|nr:ROK family glucokinase [Clostridiales bacterium]
MSKLCFGVDVGGTTIKMGLFDFDGNVLDKWEIPTRTQDSGKLILPDIAAAVLEKLEEKNLKKEEISGVGIGVPGPVDADGVIYMAANLGWGVMNISEILSNLIGIPVKAGNDANVAALGEMWKGGGQGYKNLVAVTLGTGVGGGIIVNGEMLSGATGAGGEIGHIHVEDSESQCCGCGNKGCLEQYTSATGIVRLANRKLEENKTDSILRGSEVSAKSVFDAVKMGDKLAMEVAEEFGEYLGKALAAIAGVVNPEIFVIGGGVSKAGNVLLDYIQKYYTPYVFHGSRNAKFALATL